MIQKKFSKTETVDVYDQVIKCHSFIADTTIPDKLTTNKEVTRAFGYRSTKHDKESKYLIVGTIPSISGFHEGFYYMSDGNAFYAILDKTLGIKDYEHSFCKLKEEYVKRDDKREIGKKIEDRLNDYHIVLFDTIEYCLRINSYDSGIIQYKLHSRKEFLKVLKQNKMIVILTSSEATKYFKEIFDEFKDIKIPVYKNTSNLRGIMPLDTKTKEGYEVELIQAASPSFSHTKNNETKINDIAKIYKRIIK